MLADWFPELNFTELLDNKWMLALYVAVLIAAFIIGAGVTGFVVRRLAMFVWRDLSRVALFRIRFLGGSAGAMLAYLLLGWGGGLGFGPGEGGVPSTGDRTAQSAESLDTAPSNTKASLQGLVPPAAEGRVLRVRLLGGRTTPRAEQPSRFFAFRDADATEVLDVDAVLRRGREMKEQGVLKEVELVVELDPPSAVLETPAVEQLRERVLKDLQVPFVQPDPKKLFDEPFASRKVRYDPPR